MTSPADSPDNSPPDASKAHPPQAHAARSLLRLLDANFNRAMEACRTIEDFVRFILQEPQLQSAYKSLRHDLVEAMKRLPPESGFNELVRARDSQSDVGAEGQTAAEYRRESEAAVVQANLKRLEQSLRCLEEYSKVLAEPAARELERCRYRSYALARQLTIVQQSLATIPDAALYVLIDGGRSEQACVDLAGELISAGVPMLQLRDKRLTDRELATRARQLAKLCRDTPTRLIINDRADLAQLVRADGVHVGQDELHVTEVRQLIGVHGLVGVSTHTLKQVELALSDGADYLGCGPTFPSSTKSFDHFPGPQFLREVAERTRLPAFAIGGIGLENLDEVLACGFRRVAVSCAVTSAAEPGKVAERFLERLARGR